MRVCGGGASMGQSGAVPHLVNRAMYLATANGTATTVVARGVLNIDITGNGARFERRK
ncbi:protein of unknown function [Hyphomicrobium sp. 1Nfss2.1]